MDASVRDHDLVRRSDRRAVHAAQLFGEQLEQPRHAGRLEVVAAVLVDGGPHRRFHRLRRVEADVPLIEPKRIATPYIMSRMRMMPENGTESRWEDIWGWYLRFQGFQGF